MPTHASMAVTKVPTKVQEPPNDATASSRTVRRAIRAPSSAATTRTVQNGAAVLILSRPRSVEKRLS